METESNKKYILSLDGGGIRGLIVLYFLYYLEKDLLEKTGHTVYETFDLFGGTSVGAMIIGTMVYNKYKIEDILKIYTDDVFRLIFTKNNIIYRILGSPIYDGSYKTKILNKDLGEKLLSSAEKPILFTVYSLDREEPIFYKSYILDNEETGTCIIDNEKTNEDPNEDLKYDEDYNIIVKTDPITLVADIINASSSPPIYFGSISYVDEKGQHYGIDGALFANNPCDSLYVDSIRLFEKSDIRILSIGTGTAPLKNIGAESQKWGAIDWVLKGSIIDIITDMNPVTVDYKMKQFSKALGHKYFRVEHTTNIAIDDISKIEDLKEMGHAWYLRSKDQLFSDFFK